MTIRRVPVETVADPNHGTMMMEGDSYDRLPSDRVYVNPRTGIIRDGSRGSRLMELSGNEIEIPKTTWY